MGRIVKADCNGEAREVNRQNIGGGLSDQIGGREMRNRQF